MPTNYKPWRSAKDRYKEYFIAAYNSGLLKYNKSTGQFWNTKTGTVYGPTAKKPRTQITLYCRVRGVKVKLNMLAYRLAWILFKGPLKTTDQINHKDGNKGNDRLKNLEKATNSSNQLHAYATGLRTALRGQSNPTALITNRQALRIKRALQRGRRPCDIARAMGVSVNIVYNIRYNRSWQHLKDQRHAH